ncbi:hypothetical protein R1sor_014866 [Riccia sorocarpa]|uniref:PROP1-like PPR domain-containing protein n=1 Tax=Riccia sorocarpa TaxID=122646 RepID=A0ABD3HDK7_9MARC
MPVLATCLLLRKEFRWGVALAVSHLRNPQNFARGSGAVGMKTVTIGSKPNGEEERELRAQSLTSDADGNSTEGVSSWRSTGGNIGRQEASLFSPGGSYQVRAQQQRARHELVPPEKMESLLAWVKDGRWESLVRMLGGSPADQNVRTARDCFTWLGRCGKEKASLTLFELLKKAGESEKDLLQYMRDYLSSFADSYGAQRALGSLRTLVETVQVKPDASVFEDLINLSCSRSQLSHAMDVLDEMQRHGLTLKSSCFDPLLQSFSDHLMVDEAVEALAGMSRLGVEISLASHNIVIGACVKAGDMEKAYGVLTSLQQAGVQPDTTSFNHIMKGFAQEKRLKRALSVLREMEYVGLKPDKDTYLILLRACGASKNLNEAKKLYRKVEELGLGTDQAILSAMIQVYVDTDGLTPALKLLKKLELDGVRIGVKVKSQLLRGLALAGRYEEGLQVYQELQRDGKRPSPESVATLLMALGKAGRMETMLRVFEDSNSTGSWSEYPAAYRSSYLNMFCIHICLAYIRLQMPKDAVRFLQHVSKLEVTTSKTLYDKMFLEIAAYGSAGQESGKLDSADGLALLRALKDQGVQLSRLAHEVLLDHCATLVKSEEAWEIVREMEKAGFPLNIMSRIRLFRVFVAARREHDVEKVLKGISQYDLRDRDVRLLLQKILALEVDGSNTRSGENIVSSRSLFEIKKYLKQCLQKQNGYRVS